MKNKIILIVSPQNWGGMKLSKHHYAIELAKRNKVFFLNPPTTNGVKINIERQSDNLYLIDYSDWKLRSFKNRIDVVYNMGFHMLFKRIIKKIGMEIDIIFNFDNGVYFRYMNNKTAKLNIFFPVDKLIDKNIGESKSDKAFSISKKILDEVCLPEKEKYLLNHGLSNAYEENAKKLLKEGFKKKDNKSFNIAYIGNLLVGTLDRDLLFSLINENKNIHFHLFGNYNNSYRINSSDGKLNTADSIFINKLKSFNNVTLYGVIEPTELIHYLNNMDVFLLIYKQTKHYLADNSHKLIEYLSFGKPIVSTYISHYQGTDLICMDSYKGLQFKQLFCDVLNSYSEYYTEELYKKRITYARKNSYSQHCLDIDHFISLTEEPQKG